MEDYNQLHRISQSFRGIKQAFLQFMWKELDSIGTTPIQHLVMHTLAETPDLCMTELAERINVGCSTTSGVIDRLEKAGIVERNRSTEDRRSVTIKLTKEGVEKHRETDALISKKLSGLNEIAPEDIEHLLRIHEQIKRLLEKKGEETKDES